ncbi:DUF2958 domain-containing protein [Bradyrhizobium quebecense]|uniref:DUF2958 domain-containing protein n=1 Tax=Bradyrhizobium quebecense TaxID=2748629 RepID=A0A974AGC1_9BRAD|nr:DUF2958 domain-containing protein [Bradyrhizobium quebecense]UGA43022.1 DUF2958 domain-containing protein [Bradyrhizobium quebecense]
MLDDDLLGVDDRVRLLINALANERDPYPVVKIFTPDANATWLISECDPDEPDRLFGLCDLGLNFPELGWVNLSEIKEVRGRLGLPVERDANFVANKPLSSYAEEARAKGRIIT